MGSSKNIKIPIVKDGKDICRMIFTEDIDGKFDVKIDFLGNPYSVMAYRLFQNIPEVWEVEDPSHTSLTYHHGKNNRPITIHLKDENSAQKYKSLLTNRILPPNRNSLFSIPLLKLEIPTFVIDNAQTYRQKGSHRPIVLQDDNVLEIYMSSLRSPFADLFADKFQILLYPQMFLSIEYFATYTVLTDYAKKDNFIPHGAPAVRRIGIKGLPGIMVYATKFPWPEMDSRLDKIRITFLENEFAEDILLCTLIQYPEKPLSTGIYPYIRLGSATLPQLSLPKNVISNLTNLIQHPPILPNSTVEETLKRGILSPLETGILLERAGHARIRLYNALQQCSS